MAAPEEGDFCPSMKHAHTGSNWSSAGGLDTLHLLLYMNTACFCYP